MNLPTFVLTPTTRTRRSAYFDATVAAGVKGFGVYNRMMLPTFYKSAVEDYWPIINGVSMWDVSVERQVELKGPDAHHLATLMTPRNLSKMKIGQCKYAPLCDERGGIVNDPVLLRLADDHFWFSIADSDVLLWAKGLATGMGLDVSVTEPDVSPLAIQGPLADDVAAALMGDWVRELKFFWFREFDLDDIPLVVARSGWSKQGGFELYLRDQRRGTELWDRVAAAGEPFDIQPGTPSTMERIEGGLLSWGNDMNLDYNPYEVGLGRYCDLTQDADFIAKEALTRIEAEGVKRKQIGLVIDGAPIKISDAWLPAFDLESGHKIGDVTSSCHSPRLEENIGLSVLDLDHQEPGMAVLVDVEGERRTATVTALPFIS